MPLLTHAQRTALLANARSQFASGGNFDPPPVVKLFTPDGACTWLLTELEADGDVAWGLCDLGFGSPEYGTVSLSEITAVRGKLGLPIERDRHWSAKGPISAYIQAAQDAGRIVDLPSGGR